MKKFASTYRRNELTDVFNPPGPGSGTKTHRGGISTGLNSFPEARFTDAQGMENLGQTGKSFLW